MLVTLPEGNPYQPLLESQTAWPRGLPNLAEALQWRCQNNALFFWMGLYINKKRLPMEQVTILTIPACSCTCTYSSNIYIYIHSKYIHTQYPQYPQYPLRHWRQTMPCARRLHVSPIVVIDGFHLALVEFLKGHPAIAVAVHLLRRNPSEMAHLMGKRWGKYIGNSPDLLWPYWQTHHGPKSVKPRENSTFCVDMLVGFES